MRASNFIALTLMLSKVSTGIYLQNQTSVEHESTLLSELSDEKQREVWGPILEEWALTNNKHREKRVIEFYAPLPVIVKRSDNFIPIDAPVTQSSTEIESKISLFNIKSTKPSKIVTSGAPATIYSPNKQPNKPPSHQVTETDLYLLSAIEKLVFRADIMEKRLRRLEEMTYFMMAGNRIDTAQCPGNFTRIANNCYYFGHAAGREMDWKAASKHCIKQSAALVELESNEENQEIVAFIQNNSNLRGKDFWTSGLNPGLLWIWGGSARPVAASDKNQKPTMLISGDGRCLRLAYDHSSRVYTYRGTDCSVRYNYICEQPDKTTSNEVRRLGRMRDILREDL